MTRRVVSLLCVSLLVFAVAGTVSAQDAVATQTEAAAPCSDCGVDPCGPVETCGPVASCYDDCAPVVCAPVCRPFCRRACCRPAVCVSSCYDPCYDACGPTVVGYRRGLFGCCRPVYARPVYARYRGCCW